SWAAANPPRSGTVSRSQTMTVGFMRITYGRSRIKELPVDRALLNGLEKWSQCFLHSLRQRRFGSTSARLPLARGRCGLAKRLGSRKGGWLGDISCVLFRGESED